MIRNVFYLILHSYLESASGSKSSKYSASQSQMSEWNNLSVINLMFHNQQNHQTHLLRSQNFFIAQFDYLVPRAESGSNIGNTKRGSSKFCSSENAKAQSTNLQKFLIYKIVEQDTNQNQSLDLKDAVRGYISDLAGKNLQAISPANTQLTQWQCDSKNNQLILWVREDSNDDRQFKQDDSDAQALYLYEIANSKLTRISPTRSNLEAWQIYWPNRTIFFQTRLDTDQDNLFTDKDEVTVLKYGLDTKNTVEINHSEIRSLLTQN